MKWKVYSWVSVLVLMKLVSAVMLSSGKFLFERRKRYTTEIAGCTGRGTQVALHCSCSCHIFSWVLGLYIAMKCCSCESKGRVGNGCEHGLAGDAHAQENDIILLNLNCSEAALPILSTKPWNIFCVAMAWGILHGSSGWLIKGYQDIGSWPCSCTISTNKTSMTGQLKVSWNKDKKCRGISCLYFRTSSKNFDVRALAKALQEHEQDFCLLWM